MDENRLLIKSQWHPTKNKNLKFDDVPDSSHIKHWWLCPNTCPKGCPHEWLASKSNRLRWSGCQFCTGKRVCRHTSFIEKYQEIGIQWHPTKNKDKDPYSFSHGSNEVVWWLCPNTCQEGCPHEWQATIKSRCSNRQSGCQHCSSRCDPCEHESFSYKFPDLAKEWHPTKNEEKNILNFRAFSGESVWWLCPNTCKEGCPHEWKTAINNRTSLNTGCPFCKVCPLKICEHMSIQYTHPNITNEWHPSKNGNKIPSQFIKGSHDLIWWLCPNTCPEGCPHEWEAAINNRCVAGTGCPYCSKIRSKCCKHTSFMVTHPFVASEWDYKKNEIDPFTRTSGVTDKVWWICTKNNCHSWDSSIVKRCHDNRGCPVCRYKTESKLFEYLTKFFKEVKRQFTIINCKRKLFDFYIPEINVIIELDGDQHFTQVSNWTPPEESLNNDIFKMKKATELGYRVIRVYQPDIHNEDESFLDEHLKPQLYDNRNSIVYISTNKLNLYDKHKKLYQDEIP
jgi:very-short-patch-repair endonuclease